MYTATLVSAPAIAIERNVGLFLREVRSDFLRTVRTRTFSLSSIGFPVMFYCLFGLILNHGEVGQGVSVAKYMLGSYAVFGMVGAALFGIGVGLASEITAGWLELKRASPMPAMVYLLAKCMTAISFGFLIVSILCVLGITVGHVTLSFAEYLRMLGLTAIGSFPFTAMGLLLALTVPSNAVPGVVNMIYLPMSFVSGLWIPVFLLPRWLRSVSPYMPTFHVSQLMLSIYGYQSPGSSLVAHWLSLLGFTMVTLGLAALAFRRREQNS